MAVSMETFEILRHRLWMINDEMGKKLKQLSGSPTAYLMNDYGTGLFDAAGNQVLVGCTMVDKAIALEDCTKDIVGSFQGQINEGDVFYTNDPWLGPVHWNDFASIKPLFWDGKLIGFASIAVHEPDVGGPARGSMNTKATEAFAEAPCFTPIKLFERGELRKDIERLILRNTRMPGLVGLDLRARQSALNTAQKEINEILTIYGRDTLEEVMRRIIAFASESIKYKLRRLPDGVWREEGYIDHDGFQNRLYKVAVTMTKEGEKLTFDFTGCAKQVAAAINMAPPSLKGAVILGIFPMMCYDSTWSSAAVFENVQVIAEEGTILNASYPAAVGHATVQALLTGGSIVRSCISKMYAASKDYRDEVQSGGATSIGGAGRHTPGFGARSWKDGVDSAGTPGNPVRAIGSIEVGEGSGSMLMLYFKQDFHTVGAGKYRGGMGSHCAWVSYKSDGPVTVRTFTQGVNHPAVKPLYGGYPPSVVGALILRDTNIWQLLNDSTLPGDYTDISYRELEVLEAKTEDIELEPSDVVVAFSTGGAGYGDPLERNPELVASDVSQRGCSPDTAKQIYGVVLLPTGMVNMKATEKQRELLRQQRLSSGKPVNADIFKQNSQRRVSGNSVMTIGDCLKVVQSDSQHFIVCARCGYLFSSLAENYKLGAWVYETPMEVLSPLNQWAPGDGNMVVKHFCCPSCALTVGCEVSKREDPPLFDTLVKLG